MFKDNTQVRVSMSTSYVQQVQVQVGERVSAVKRTGRTTITIRTNQKDNPEAGCVILHFVLCWSCVQKLEMSSLYIRLIARDSHSSVMIIHNKELWMILMYKWTFSWVTMIPNIFSFRECDCYNPYLPYRSLIDLEGDSLMMKMGAESSELMLYIYIRMCEKNSFRHICLKQLQYIHEWCLNLNDMMKHV